jgi:hypothetical protein
MFYSYVSLDGGARYITRMLVSNRTKEGLETLKHLEQQPLWGTS